MADLLSRLRRALSDRYRIEREVGRGATGAVYLATDLKHGRQVALKVFRPELGASIGPERFQREIRIAAGLNHPNIVSLIDSGEADGLLYYVMFYVEGESLRDRLDREKQLPLDDALRITREVGAALAYAHEHGVVHRDVKPGNILFAAGQAVVTDFGIARAISAAGGDRLTETGLAVGTPVYMSPEQATGTDPVDARSDVYSLASVLYEMLAGSPPWAGATVAVLFARKTMEGVPSLRVARRSVPPALESAVARALSPAPADRQASVAEFIRSLAAEPAPVRRRRLRPPRAVTYTLAVLATVLVIASVARFTIDGRGAPSPMASFAQVTAEPGVEDSPSLSPDGEWVVYAGEGAGGDRDIFLRSIGDQRVIPLTGDSPADDTQPAFSPGGDMIAFRSSRDGGGLFVMSRTGERVRRITDVGYNPSWAPDGRHLAYGLENVGLKPLNGELTSRIWVVPIDGGAPRQVSADTFDTVDPSWSPGGQRIAYTARNAVSRMDIHTIPAAGGAPVPVMVDEANEWSPTWSGDGRHLYFVSDRGGSMNLWRIAMEQASGRVVGEPEPIGAPAQFAAHPSSAADGRVIAFSNVVTTSQNVQKAAFDPATGAVRDAVWLTTGTRPWSNPDPSPDGASVVVYSQERPEGDLYVLRSDGTGLPRQLTADSAIDRVPRWSPDGSRILYFSTRGGPLDLWTIRADGTDNRQITRTRAGVGAWSPDGARIAATTDSAVAIVDPARPWEDQDVEWLPADTTPGRFAVNDWSPDGRHLAGSIDYRDTGIVVYSFETRTYRRLTDFGQWPVWLPDGRRLLFVSGGNAFYMVDAVTSQVARVHTSPWDVIGPPRLAPDAREIFYSRRVTEGDIWLVRFD